MSTELIVFTLLSVGVVFDSFTSHYQVMGNGCIESTTGANCITEYERYHDHRAGAVSTRQSPRLSRGACQKGLLISHTQQIQLPNTLRRLVAFSFQLVIIGLYFKCSIQLQAPDLHLQFYGGTFYLSYPTELIRIIAERLQHKNIQPYPWNNRFGIISYAIRIII